MQQAQQMVGQQGGDSFGSWYKAGSQLGGAVFGGMANAKNDGVYDDSIVGGVGSDKENYDAIHKYDNDPFAVSQDYQDSVMGNIAQSGDQFIGSSGDGDTNIDAIGAFVNGYRQASKPDIIGLQQGLQLGQNAIGNMANGQYGFDPNWRLKIGGRY